jgi:hypothetical protein
MGGRAPDSHPDMQAPTADRARAASAAGTPPRSYEIPVSRREMLQSPAALRPQAVASLQRMTAVARERNAELRVQVPADMASSVPLIRDAAPQAVIRIVDARQPFKLVIATGRRTPAPDERSAALGIQARARDVPPPAPLVVIHLRDEMQDPIAERCAERLGRAGVRVADTRVLVPLGPRSTQLRYFHSEDRVEAANLAHTLASLGLRVGLLDLSKDYRNTLPARRYELWLAPG